MIVQKHREYCLIGNKKHFFIVAKSREEMFAGLRQYLVENPSDDVWYHEHEVRPSKENLRPEYMMEVTTKTDNIMFFWNRY